MKIAPIEQLGAGASADVWLAEDLDLRRKVAVKFFRDSEASIHERVALDHARALARLQHPAVVTIFSVERQKHPESNKECLAVVMEFVDGTPLSKFSEGLSFQRASALLDDLASGLDAIHAAQMVHGDFHEGNIVVTPRGGKILDILYTRSLADASSRSAAHDRQADIRDFAKIARKVLEKSEGTDLERLTTAHYRAESAATARGAVDVFWDELLRGKQSPAARHPGVLGMSDFYLVLIRQSAFSYPKTLVFSRSHSEGAFIAVGVLPSFYHAFSDKLWVLRPGKRTFRLLDEAVLEKWRLQQDLVEEDYRLATIFDPALLSITDEVLLPLAHSEPHPLAKQEYFSFERGLVILGALGRFVFTEQHDYLFGGGAHGGVSSWFRLFDLEQMRVVEEPIDLFSSTERNHIENYRDIARQTFRALRGEELVLEEAAVDFVSLRPCIEHERPERLGMRLLFTTVSSYAASDGRWASYTISEEIALRSQPAAVAPFTRLPEGLQEALGADVGAVVGWSQVSVGHPAYRHLFDRLHPGHDHSRRRPGTVLGQHNQAAPWRTPYHGLTEEDIAKAVAEELAERSQTSEQALSRLSEQLHAEFDAAGRVLSDVEFATCQAYATLHITQFFQRINREP